MGPIIGQKYNDKENGKARVVPGRRREGVGASAIYEKNRKKKQKQNDGKKKRKKKNSETRQKVSDEIEGPLSGEVHFFRTKVCLVTQSFTTLPHLRNPKDRKDFARACNVAAIGALGRVKLDGQLRYASK